jgi:hypothetical protein
VCVGWSAAGRVNRENPPLGARGQRSRLVVPARLRPPDRGARAPNHQATRSRREGQETEAHEAFRPRNCADLQPSHLGGGVGDDQGLLRRDHPAGRRVFSPHARADRECRARGVERRAALARSRAARARCRPRDRRGARPRCATHLGHTLRRRNHRRRPGRAHGPALPAWTSRQRSSCAARRRWTNSSSTARRSNASSRPCSSPPSRISDDGHQRRQQLAGRRVALRNAASTFATSRRCDTT